MDWLESASCANQMPAFPIAVSLLPDGFALNNEFEGASPDVKKEPEEMLQNEHAEQADGGGATPLNIRIGASNSRLRI